MRKSRQSTRHTTAAFGPRQAEKFVRGMVWTPCESSDVKEAMWNPEREILTIGFLDGSYYEYPITEDMAASFAYAPSKGGWIWDTITWPGRAYWKIQGRA